MAPGQNKDGKKSNEDSDKSFRHKFFSCKYSC
jgi:hypothetical protein